MEKSFDNFTFFEEKLEAINKYAKQFAEAALPIFEAIREACINFAKTIQPIAEQLNLILALHYSTDDSEIIVRKYLREVKKDRHRRSYYRMMGRRKQE